MSGETDAKRGTRGRTDLDGDYYHGDAPDPDETRGDVAMIEEAPGKAASAKRGKASE